MIWLISKLKYPFYLLLVAIFGALLFYYFTAETKRDLSPAMEELSIQACEDFAHKLPRLQNVEKLLVVPVVGGRDEDFHLQSLITSSIARQRKYTINTWTSLEAKLKNGSLWQKLLDQMGWLPGDAPTNIEKATVVARALKRANVEIDGILLIKCFFDQGPRDDALGAKIELEGQILKTLKEPYQIADLNSLSASRSISSPWDTLYLTHKVQSFGYISRLLAWAIFSFGLPWGFMPITRFVLGKRSTALNISYLSFIIAVSAFCSWFFLTALASIFYLGTIVFILALGALAYWVNYDALDYIERKLL